MDNENITAAKGSEENKYEFGLALGGGGARGLAHAGALKALEEVGLKPDILAGVSAGSIIAVMYAAGVTPDEILDAFSHAKFSDLSEIRPGKGGIMKIDERFGHFLGSRLNGIKNIEDLNIPTYIGVTNFDDGVAEEFHTGPIRQIVTASCSIPIAIRPVKIGGKTYVDGGVLHNLPAWIIRDKCRRLAGINVSPMMHGKVKDSFFSVAMRTYNLLAKSNQNQDMALCDLVVTTEEISHHRVFSLKEISKVFDAGYKDMKEALSRAQWA